MSVKMKSFTHPVGFLINQNLYKPPPLLFFMTEQSLQTIEVKNILANFSQPREHFDQEKIKELAESILSNGLIQPITVRNDPKRKGKYMIVAGERRWMAHRMAKLQTISAFVKEYDNDFKFMIESSIENYQREDVTSYEKEKDIWNVYQQGLKDGMVKNYKDLAKIMGLSEFNISNIIRAKESREKLKIAANISTRDLSDTSALEDKDRKKLLNKVEDGKIESKSLRQMTKIIKKAPENVKEALLDDKISVSQAEDLTNMQSNKAREKVLKEVKGYMKESKRVENLGDISPKLSKKANPELTDAVKKKFGSLQRTIFTNLYEAKVGIIKSNKFLKNANQMLSRLMEHPFENGLDEKTLKSSLEQLKLIADKLSEFNIQTERFDDVKESFIDRIENREITLK